MSTEVPAVVGYAPQGAPNWRYETVKIRREVKEHEVQVRLISTGICHTDVFLSCVPHGAAGIEYPKIFGHEGAGYVEAVGSAVTRAKVGDPVVLSYAYCQTCDICKDGHTAYCLSWQALNVPGEKDIFQSATGEDAGGKFFGQSSFASKSIVQETSVVNVKDLVHNDDELKLIAPLGCGIMTGAGAVLNSAKARPHDIVLVTGIGAVGLGAITAAKISGCREIIAVDRVASRLQIAKEFGATQILDTSAPNTSLEDVPKLVNNQRISYVIETTGIPAIIVSAAKVMGKNGKLVQIGIPPPGAELTIPFFGDFYSMNKSIECHMLGDEEPKTLIPKILGWWRDGKFPLEKVVKFFPAKDVLQGLHGMESGSAIKPVLVW